MTQIILVYDTGKIVEIDKALIYNPFPEVEKKEEEDSRRSDPRIPETAV